jgi:hypothetical protein
VVKKAKSPIPKRSSHYWYFHILTLLIILIIVAVNYIYQRQSVVATPAAGPLSRQVNLYQQAVIKRLKPPPTLAALQYAYVASAYMDGLKQAGQAGALAAAQAMLNTLYPVSAAATGTAVKTLEQINHVTASTASVQGIINRYDQRYNSDGHDLVWDGIIPTGPDKWRKVTAKDPLTPEAGNWQRWNVTQTISIPPPPVFGSAEDLRQLDNVQRIVAKRNGQDINLINFWGGTPGTETPGGIWQNQLYRTVHGDLPRSALKADDQYSSVQASLAQTVSDAFMECWKAKYTYWTARPSMRLPGLVTAMDNPLFPSYISGHSTVSKAAADTLSVTVPKYAQQWEAMADQARYSRLVAGIHFDIDNAEGYVVGSAVAVQTISSLHLTKVIN